MMILMTGSTSFIGRHLIPLLENAGHDVYHLVREKKGFQQEFIWDLKGLLPKNLPVCDAVVHLAAYVDFTNEMKIGQYLVNTLSTASLVRYCQETDASIIFASMIGVHGNQKHIFVNSSISPTNHYGMSKYLAEQIVRIFGVNAYILRIAGIYGLNGPAHLGLNAAITNAIRYKKAPILRGPGNGKRNYICVKDVAGWIFQLIQTLKREKLGDRRKTETLYLAGPENITIEQYLQNILEILLPGEQIVFQEGQASEDCLVEKSPPPFPLTRFRDYLSGLKQQKS